MSTSAGTTKRKRTTSAESSSNNLTQEVLQPDPRGDPSEDDAAAHPTKRAKSQKAEKPGLPPTSLYLPIAIGGNHWHATDSMQTIVVLGDSYSKSSDGQKTWVDHLKRRLRRVADPPQVHNFAFPGATAQDDLADQVSRLVALFPKTASPQASPRLDPDGTTYFVFFGINDCGSNDNDDLEPIVEGIGDALHDLYVKAGARNFVLVDVPPIPRSPQAVDAGMSDEIEERVKTWNELLQAQITEFGTSSKEATTLLFSAHQVLSEVLDDPSEFDFGEDDPETEGGGIWEDDLHLTEDVHDVLAERLITVLSASK